MKRRIAVTLIVLFGIVCVACSKNEAASSKCAGSSEFDCMTCCKANGATGTITTKVNGRFKCGCGGKQ